MIHFACLFNAEFPNVVDNQHKLFIFQNKHRIKKHEYQLK